MCAVLTESVCKHGAQNRFTITVSCEAILGRDLDSMTDNDQS